MMRPGSPPLATVCGSGPLVIADRSGASPTNRGSYRQLGPRRVSSDPLGGPVDGSVLITFALAAAAWTGPWPAGVPSTRPVPTAPPPGVDDERLVLPRRGWAAVTIAADRNPREFAADRCPEA
jgi:hypothetical protein